MGGLEPARFLDTGPEAAEGSHLGDGQELVGIGDEQEGERLARLRRVVAARLQGAQIGDPGREDGRQLLRLGGAGLMVGAPVGPREASGEAALRQRREPGGECLFPGRHLAGSRGGADRIEAEIEVERGEIMTTPARKGDKGVDRRIGIGSGIEPDGDKVEHDAAKRAVQDFRCRGDKAETPCRGRARADDRQGVRPAGEVLEDQFVGGLDLRVIHPRDDAPRHGSAARDAAIRPRIERIDADAVIGLAEEGLVEVAALESLLGGGSPGLARRGGELGGESEIGHAEAVAWLCAACNGYHRRVP